MQVATYAHAAVIFTGIAVGHLPLILSGSWVVAGEGGFEIGWASIIGQWLWMQRVTSVERNCYKKAAGRWNLQRSEVHEIRSGVTLKLTVRQWHVCTCTWHVCTLRPSHCACAIQAGTTLPSNLLLRSTSHTMNLSAKPPCTVHRAAMLEPDGIIHHPISRCVSCPASKGLKIGPIWRPQQLSSTAVPSPPSHQS
jgi:hypothetical protein